MLPIKEGERAVFVVGKAKPVLLEGKMGGASVMKAAYDRCEGAGGRKRNNKNKGARKGGRERTRHRNGKQNLFSKLFTLQLTM